MQFWIEISLISDGHTWSVKLTQINASANVYVHSKLEFWGFLDINWTKYEGASSNWQYLNSRDLTFSCALGKALQF